MPWSTTRGALRIKTPLILNEDARVLTDAGQQIIEPLFGEKRVLQTAEVKFENASHRVDVVIILIIRQWVVS